MHALKKGASPLASRLFSRVIATSAVAESAPATAAASKAPLNREFQIYRWASLYRVTRESDAVRSVGWLLQSMVMQMGPR